MKRLAVVLALAASSLWAQSAETIPFRAVMLPSNEVPAVNINASGAATIWLHVVRDASGNIVSASTDFNVSHQFPGEIRFTGLHIHRGRAGENGPVTIDSGIRGAEPVVSATGTGVLNYQGQTLSSNTAGLETVNGMLTDPGGYYVNLHSTVNPGGVIRGQLERAEMVVLMGLMSPANEVPPVTGTNASAFGTVVALATCGTTRLADCPRPTSGQVIFDAVYSGIGEDQRFSGFHIHDGPAGVNGPVRINTGISGGANAIPANAGGGVLHYEVEVPVSNADSANTLAGLYRNPAGYYINIHTLTNPGGVIRAQLRRTDKMQFPVSMLPGNEVPPLTDPGSAPAVFTAHTIRNADGAVAGGVAIFDVNYRFPGAETFRGLHIHNGRAGENGPVTIDTGVNATNTVVTESGQGNIYRIVNVTSPAGLATLNSLAANPELHYINLHSNTRPGGVVRSQLAAANTALPTVSAVISAVSDPTLRTVAPGGLMTVFGANFVKTAVDIGSAFEGAKLPTAFNGMQVSVGGKPAALLIVMPTYIVAQVPMDAAQGNQSVVVKNANGEMTTAATVQVANVAPALYFNADGGIFTKLDYTLVSASNPARPGDLIWSYGTGFGALTPRGGVPALSTGDLPMGIYDTGAVTVTVGGREARVVEKIAAPGYAGLYQVLFEVPQGVTGNAAVQMRMGMPVSGNVGTPSNSVMLVVR